MADFWTSDWHFDHGNILKYCGRTDFMTPHEKEEYERLMRAGDRRMRELRISRGSVEHMNTGLIDGMNSVARQQDTIWCLGDVFFGGDLNRLWELRNRIVCRKINLVLGNHDKDIRHWHRFLKWGQSTRTPEAVVGLRRIIDDLAAGKITAERATKLADKIEIRNPLEGIFDHVFMSIAVNVNGQSITMNHYAQAVWDKNAHGAWHLYGHSHGNFETWREEHLAEAKLLDVGVDYRAKLGKGYTPWSFDDIRRFMDSRNGEAVDHHGLNRDNDDGKETERGRTRNSRRSYRGAS